MPLRPSALRCHIFVMLVHTCETHVCLCLYQGPHGMQDLCPVCVCMCVCAVALILALCALWYLLLIC
jgi:hypothetical protein